VAPAARTGFPRLREAHRENGYELFAQSIARRATAVRCASITYAFFRLFWIRQLNARGVYVRITENLWRSALESVRGEFIVIAKISER